jgi:ATP-dependent Clp protease ATP-binding subunit ClpC
MTRNGRRSRRQFLIQSSAAALGAVAIPVLFVENRASGVAVPDEQPLREENFRFNRYTDRARKVVQLAYQEARRRNYTSVGTEHILFGLIREGSGVAAHVLKKNFGFNLDKMRLEVAACLTAGTQIRVLGRLRKFKLVLACSTPEVKRLFESALNQARNLQHNYVGTEHLLLALLLQRGGVAPVLLSRWGLKHDIVHAEIRNLLGT